MFTCTLVLNRPYLWHRKFDDVDLLDVAAFVSEHCDDVNLIHAVGDCRLFFAGFDTVSVPDAVLVLCRTNSRFHFEHKF